MKQTLLFFLCISVCTWAQSPITTLNGTLATGENNYLYHVVTSTTYVDQNLGGANMTWNFGTVTNGDAVAYNNLAVSTGELTNFPSSTMHSSGNSTTNSAYNTGQYSNASYAVTGVVTNDYIIYYSEDYPASFGTFPLSYTTPLNNISVAGTYWYDGYAGTFTGNFQSKVDAYGTLQFGSTESAAVTRLKSVETLDLSYPGFGIVGGYSQTTYRYYRAGDIWPVFKSTRTLISIPILDIDVDTIVYEKADVSLGVPLVSKNQIALYPNPTTDLLTLSTADNVQKARIMDLSGKTLMETNSGAKEWSLASFAPGIYLAEITTDKGTETRKIVKR